MSATNRVGGSDRGALCDGARSIRIRRSLRSLHVAYPFADRANDTSRVRVGSDGVHAAREDVVEGLPADAVVGEVMAGLEGGPRSGEMAMATRCMWRMQSAEQRGWREGTRAAGGHTSAWSGTRARGAARSVRASGGGGGRTP